MDWGTLWAWGASGRRGGEGVTPPGCSLRQVATARGCWASSHLREPPRAPGHWTLGGLAGALALGRWLRQRLIGSVNLVQLLTER